MSQVLHVTFDSAEAFHREYSENLVNGGTFVATEQPFELRERVSVELALPFCDKSLAISGEVVHRVTPDMAQMGAPVGVAVQFDGAAQGVRKMLEPLRTASGAPEHRPSDSGRRSSPRMRARVAARISAGGEDITGHTRDLSQGGVLVAVAGAGVPVGEKIRLQLAHPENGAEMEVEGIVARQVTSRGGVDALGIQFAPSENERQAVASFVENLQTSEHARRLGGIKGDIEELGIQHVLQMFTSTTPAGTLAVKRGREEGVVGFEGGLLRYARLGPASGLKALARLVSWNEGTFEFHARLDPVEETDAPLPIEAALMEAVRLLDESNRFAPDRFPPDATPVVMDEAAAASDTLGKLEAAVIDLVRAGFTVQRIVEVIPEPDAQVYGALLSLSERGVLAF